LAFPGESPTKLETDAFLLLGKLQPNELRDVAEEVDKALEKATNVLKLPTAKSVHKGRTTVYVLPKRYDYGEFGQMVEKRRLPIEMHGHWQSQGFMPYIVVGPQTEASIPTQALLGRCLAALLVSSWSDVPEWYADGMGHVAAERMSRRDPQIRTWPSRAASLVRNLESPAQLLSGDLAPEVAGIVNWAFVRYLMQDGRRSSRLLHALQKGAAFETAFVGAYGAPPDAYCERWFKRNTGKRK